MERNYMRSWLVGLAALLGGATIARAQEPPPVRMNAEQGPGADQSQSIDPTGPIQTGTVADAQYFKQPDLTQIGNPDLNYGPWFQYERLYWSLHQPSTTEIGNAAVAREFFEPNDNSTGFMNAGFVYGNRYDLGYRCDDNMGWETSILKTNTQHNILTDAFPTNVAFQNNEPTVFVPGPPAGGPTPVPAYALAYPSLLNVVFANTTRMTGVELMRTYRYPVAHDGGIWTAGVGARFFQLHDRFDATGNVAPSIFTASAEQTITYAATGAPIAWDLGIDNDIVGPQIELGYEYDKDRWAITSSLRAMFGANFENAAEYGYNGGDLNDVVTTPPINDTFNQPGKPSNNFFDKENRIEFAPLGELRVNAEYKFTQNVSLTVGYTALLVTGIGRAANRIEYAVPDMGIINGADKEHFFANGVNFGFEINH